MYTYRRRTRSQDGVHTGIEEPAVSIHPDETEQLFQVPPAFQHLQEEALLFDEPNYPPDPNHHRPPPQDYVEHHSPEPTPHHPEPIHHHPAPAYKPDQHHRPQQYHPPPKASHPPPTASHPPPVPAIFPVSGTGGVLLLPDPPGHHGHKNNYGPPPAGYNHVRRPPRTRVKANILGKLLKLKG